MNSSTIIKENNWDEELNDLLNDLIAIFNKKSKELANVEKPTVEDEISVHIYIQNRIRFFSEQSSHFKLDFYKKKFHIKRLFELLEQFVTDDEKIFTGEEMEPLLNRHSNVINYHFPEITCKNALKSSAHHLI